MPNDGNSNKFHDISLNLLFSPLASSSQQCNISKKQLSSSVYEHNPKEITKTAQDICHRIYSTSMSKSGLWSSFVSTVPNETDQEITLTQLNSIVTGNTIWTSESWIRAQQEYSVNMTNSTINALKKNVNQVIAFLAAIIVKVECAKDSIIMNSVTLTLKDPSGEIKAVITKELHAECEHLQCNSVVVLRNVRILKISKDFARYYILLSKENIEAVFSSTTHTKIQFFEYESTQLPNVLPPYQCQPTVNKKMETTNEIQANIEHGCKSTLEATHFEIPDLDLDLDFDADTDCHANETKKQKLELVPYPNVNNGNLCGTTVRRFKYVKPNKEVVDGSITNTRKHCLASTVSADCIDGNSDVKVKAKNPQDSQIVQEIFDGFDVSCLFDDF